MVGGDGRVMFDSGMAWLLRTVRTMQHAPVLGCCLVGWILGDFGEIATDMTPRPIRQHIPTLVLNFI